MRVSGEITTTALLDRELKSEYILIVRAVDGGVGPQQKTGIATVTTLQPSSFLQLTKQTNFLSTV